MSLAWVPQEHMLLFLLGSAACQANRQVPSKAASLYLLKSLTTSEDASLLAFSRRKVDDTHYLRVVYLWDIPLDE
eukprot:scaffold33734_cov36-Prasinocladus_malaysianus.AAC.1